MPKPKGHMTGPPRALGRRLPSEKELFEAADAITLISHRPEAEADQKNFLRDAEAYLEWLHIKNDEPRRIAFLVELVLRCPQLLGSSPESEWARRALEECLVQRILDHDKDKIFWIALKLAGKRIRTGRKRNRVLDAFRYKFIDDLVNPPKQLRNMVVKFNKTQSIGKLAEVEGIIFGTTPDTRPLWRSHGRLDRPLQSLKNDGSPESVITHPPGERSDTVPRKSVDRPKRLKTKRLPQRKLKRK